MYIKLLDCSEVIGDKYCCDGFTEKIKEKYIDDVKEKVKEGYKVLIRNDGKWIKGKEYFSDENKKEVTDILYDDIFSGHYTKRADKVKDHTDDIDKVEKMLKYAKDNDESDSVIEDIEEYIEELK